MTADPSAALAAIRARVVEAPVPTRAEWREFMGGQITDAQWHEFQHSWYREQFPIAREDVRRMADALDAVLALCEEAYADHDYPLVTASSIHRAITAHLALADEPTTEEDR